MHRMFLAVTAVVVLASAPPVSAAPLTINATATVDKTFSFSGDFWPIGTMVTTNLTFDLGSGTFFAAPTGGATGLVNWSVGGTDYEIDLTGTASWSFASSSGEVVFRFAGSEPTFTDIEFFDIAFDIGTNPFTSSSELFDLILGSTITGLGLEANNGSIGFTHPSLAPQNLTYAIEPGTVPEPTTLALLSVGLLGAGAIRCRHGRRRLS
jgi:hypothetical protein